MQNLEQRQADTTALIDQYGDSFKESRFEADIIETLIGINPFDIKECVVALIREVKRDINIRLEATNDIEAASWFLTAFVNSFTLTSKALSLMQGCSYACPESIEFTFKSIYSGDTTDPTHDIYITSDEYPNVLLAKYRINLNGDMGELTSIYE